MQRAFLYSRLKCNFVPFVLILILLSSGAVFAGDTSVHLDKGDITGITRVAVRKDGKVTLYVGTSRRIVDAAKLPPGFLASWGIDANAVTASATQTHLDGFEKALDEGKFRVVNGVVYDLRQNNPGWKLYVVKLVAKLADDEAVVDLNPDGSNGVGGHVLHFSAAVPSKGEDRFKFVGMFIGNSKFKYKKGEVVTLQNIDLGREAEREELPDAILKEGKASAPLVSSDAGRSSMANLPQAEHLLGMGTAFFITADGYLVTADHVVRGIHKVRVKTGTQYYDAKVIKSDQKVDLALLKIEGSSFVALPLAGKKDPDLGADVFTIGFPNPDVQGFEPKYTDGKISSLSGARDDPSKFQISVPIQPGNSGGPLINRYGAVDGVVVSALSGLAMLVNSGAIPENVNYAVKTSTLRDFLAPVQELDGKMLTQSGSRKHADVMKRAQESVVMVLGYK
jgi:S1-C subfamily serine protease